MHHRQGRHSFVHGSEQRDDRRVQLAETNQSTVQADTASIVLIIIDDDDSAVVHLHLLRIIHSVRLIHTLHTYTSPRHVTSSSNPVVIDEIFLDVNRVT